MRYAWLLVGALVWAQENVNSRYTVESVEIAGVPETTLSKGLRARMQELVGQKFSQQKVTALARSMRRELPGRRVTEKIARGLQIDHVKVIFEIRRPHYKPFDVATGRALYHSKQGWSGDLNAHVRVESSVLSFGIVSDADPLLERYAGVKAGYEKRGIGTDRLRLGFQFESYHQIWNGATRSGPESDIYRTRQNFQPQLTVLPARGLRLSFGASFERLQMQFPAARTEASNALVSTLRYDRSLEDSASNTHRFEAGYSLRAATRTLDSDFVYARHTGDFRYTLTHHRNRLSAHLMGGVMSGRAPLFERFVLGNSATLRGWNKFDVAPLGGDRVVHGAIEYGYGVFRIFYDTGAVWTRGQQPEAKHSLGLGFRVREYFLAVAFPIKAGRAEPTFMTGVNF